MKLVNIIVSTFQMTLVILYILFYNVQYFYSLYGTVQNVINWVTK
jgi:hypothetical protein